MQAIRRESEAALAEITSRHPDGARVVRTILLRLVQFGEGAPNTRRQVEYQELAAAVADARMFEDVYQVLVSHRLLSPGSRRRSTDASTSGSMPAPAGSEPTEVAVVDLSHEAIIDGWEQLKEWLVKGRSIEVRRRQWELRAEQHNRVRPGAEGARLNAEPKQNALAKGSRRPAAPD